MSKRNKAKRGPLTPKMPSTNVGGETIGQSYTDRGIEFICHPDGHELHFMSISGRDDRPSVHQRMAIFQRNREFIEANALASIEKGLTDFAYLIEEMRIGDNGNTSEEENFVQQCQRNSVIPTRIKQMPRQVLFSGLRKFQEMLHQVGKGDPLRSPMVESLAEPAQPNHVWVVVLAARGKQSTQLLIPRG